MVRVAPPVGPVVAAPTEAHLPVGAAVLRRPALAFRGGIPPTRPVRTAAGLPTAVAAQAAPGGTRAATTPRLGGLAEQGEGAGVAAPVLPRPVPRAPQREAAARAVPGVAIQAHAPLREAAGGAAAGRAYAANAGPTSRVAPTGSGRHVTTRKAASPLPRRATQAIGGRPRAATGGVAAGPSVAPKGVVRRVGVELGPTATVVPALLPAALRLQVRTQTVGGATAPAEATGLGARRVAVAAIGPASRAARGTAGGGLGGPEPTAVLDRTVGADAGPDAAGGRRSGVGRPVAAVGAGLRGPAATGAAAVAGTAATASAAFGAVARARDWRSEGGGDGRRRPRKRTGVGRTPSLKVGRRFNIL